MTTIFHIDVNSAFLSWTALSLPVDEAHPDLRTIPSIIGGDEATRHGIVLAKSVPAKKFGIRTAEPVASALRKCPELTIAPPDHALYRKRSRELMELLSSYTQDLEQISIDECFMDFGPIADRYPSPREAADRMRAQIRRELGFTVNIGISVNKLLAKMASDFEKPDKTHTLYPDEIQEKMWPLPVDELFMVGRASASRLHRLGIHTIGDLARTSRAFLEAQFHSHGGMMYEYANGIASDEVRRSEAPAKGIGSSVTLPKDLEKLADLENVLFTLSEKVSSRLKKQGVRTECVMVEIKYSDFSCASHQTTLPSSVSEAKQLCRVACSLLKEFWNGAPVRLLGLRTTRLVSEDAPVQLTLFDLPNLRQIERKKKAEAAAAKIRGRFGDQSISLGWTNKGSRSDAADPK